VTDAPPPPAPAITQPFALFLPVRAVAEVPERHSVYAEAEREADVYKWIESEKAGYDLGEEALRQWARLHWQPFLRACWLEHLRGRRYWSEIDRGDFGLLARVAGNKLLAEIVGMLRAGRENLDVILWAREAGSAMDEVLAILEGVDVNSRRLPHRFDSDHRAYPFFTS